MCNQFCNCTQKVLFLTTPRAAVVQLNFRAGSTFPVPVCTVPSSMDRTCRCNKVDAVRLYALYRLNLLFLKGQICVTINFLNKNNFSTLKKVKSVLFLETCTTTLNQFSDHSLYISVNTMYCFAFYQVGNETIYEVDFFNLLENNLSLSEKVSLYFKMIRVFRWMRFK